MELSLLSARESAAELGTRIRRERLRQNLTQHTLAARAGVSRVTVTRMEASGTATLVNFLAVLAALRRAEDLDDVLAASPAETFEQFVADSEPTRRRGRR